MGTFNDNLQTARVFLLPLVLVLLTCYGLYQSHEASIARPVQRIIK